MRDLIIIGGGPAGVLRKHPERSLLGRVIRAEGINKITLRPRLQVADDFSQLRLELDDYPRFLVTSICEEVVC